MSQIREGIGSVLTNAITSRCNCPFDPWGVYYGEFSCRNTKEQAIYWSKINGRSSTSTATELLAFLQDWIDTDGKFTMNGLRMEVSKTCSPLRLRSFHQPECADETNKPARTGGSPQTFMDKCLNDWLENECGSAISASNATEY